MKVFVFALLFVVAAVQGRSARVEATRTPAALGENPWVVHLRFATTNGNGLLSTCVGSLIAQSWVLTTASCVRDVTFIWIRYGAVDVVRPQLVTETRTITIDEASGLAIIGINRVVDITDNIAPVSLPAADAEVPESATLCAYGAEGAGPGELLSCSDVALEASDDSILGTGDDVPTSFDIGAPLVADGVQVGVLTGVDGDTSVYASTASSIEWIESVINA